MEDPGSRQCRGAIREGDLCCPQCLRDWWWTTGNSHFRLGNKRVSPAVQWMVGRDVNGVAVYGNAVWKLSGLRPFGEHLGRWRTSEDCCCIGICTIYIECLFKESTSLMKKFMLNGFSPPPSSPGLDDWESTTANYWVSLDDTRTVHMCI